MTPEKRREMYGLLCDVQGPLNSLFRAWPEDWRMVYISLSDMRETVQGLKSILEMEMDEDAS